MNGARGMRRRAARIASIALLALLAVPGMAVADGGFTATGGMTTSRMYQTATLLPSGKVLITGGQGDSGLLSSAELYDPASGTFTATGSMTTTRYTQTATLLPGGKVLVSGGYGGSGSLSSAELYDPASVTFTATGSMTTSRYGQSATLLPGGKVLITGGADSSGSVLSSAELFTRPPPAAPVLTGQPAARTKSTSASIGFSGKAGASFTCSVDGGAYVECAAPMSLTGLSEGPHSLAVKQADQAGNISDAAVASWTVDLTGPVAPVLSGVPASPTSATGASIGFSGEDGASFQCSTDGGALSDCVSPKVLTGLSDGVHSLSVKQTDQAGNTGPAVTATWSVLPAPPVLSSSPTSLVNSRSASFFFSGLPSATFACSLDDAAFSACSSGKSYMGLSDGQHRFRVRQASAKSGLVSEATTFVWTVDSMAPLAPSIAAKPSAFVSSTSVSLSFSGEAGASFACAVDGGALSACSSPKSLNGLRDGQHSFSVKQTDRAGNTGPASTPVSWVVDTQPPLPPVFLSGGAPSFLSGVSGPATNQTSVVLTFAAPTDPKFTCSVDSKPATSCTSPVRLSGLSQGWHTLDVSHADAAGNKSSSRARWLVDTTAPVVSSAAKSGNNAQTAFLPVIPVDASGIAKAETSIAVSKPSDSSNPVPARVVSYKYPLVISGSSSQSYWLRVQDGAGNWSKWVKVS